MIVGLLIVNFLTVGRVVGPATLTRVNHLSARCLLYQSLSATAKLLPLHNLLDRASLSLKFAPRHNSLGLVLPASGLSSGRRIDVPILWACNVPDGPPAARLSLELSGHRCCPAMERLPVCLETCVCPPFDVILSLSAVHPARLNFANGLFSRRTCGASYACTGFIMA